ncbi:tyrosine-type recombinase/integrase [Kosakonia oryziphila]|uniref:tyrosine-type recombinase/integrase n=1 Tax=Kosakonia oryziphila TaxID=1005667 RepID=UPI003CC65D32
MVRGTENDARQAAHALRHTFATHFMMKGGNIIVLQRILGHSDISQTMTYAHFALDYLQDAVSYNPLSDVSTLCPHNGGNLGVLKVS